MSTGKQSDGKWQCVVLRSNKQQVTVCLNNSFTDRLSDDRLWTRIDSSWLLLLSAFFPYLCQIRGWHLFTLTSQPSNLSTSWLFCFSPQSIPSCKTLFTNWLTGWLISAPQIQVNIEELMPPRIRKTKKWSQFDLGIELIFSLVKSMKEMRSKEIFTERSRSDEIDESSSKGRYWQI